MHTLSQIDVDHVVQQVSRVLTPQMKSKFIVTPPIHVEGMPTEFGAQISITGGILGCTHISLERDEHRATLSVVPSEGVCHKITCSPQDLPDRLKDGYHTHADVIAIFVNTVYANKFFPAF